MSDDIDRAQNEVDRAQAEAQRMRRPEGPAPTGQCLECGELVAIPRRWCDSDCRDAWEKYRAR